MRQAYDLFKDGGDPEQVCYFFPALWVYEMKWGGICSKQNYLFDDSLWLHFLVEKRMNISMLLCMLDFTMNHRLHFLVILWMFFYSYFSRINLWFSSWTGKRGCCTASHSCCCSISIWTEVSYSYSKSILSCRTETLFNMKIKNCAPQVWWLHGFTFQGSLQLQELEIPWNLSFYYG